MMKIRWGLFGIVLSAIAWGAPAADALRSEPIAVGTAVFQVEVAKTPQQRELGLMFRRELAKDAGMLFEQPPGQALFWMKNTYIPLDLLYFDAEGRLSQIEAGVPPCTTQNCPIYRSQASTIRYILEINAGEAARRSIQPGDRLKLPE